MSGISIDDLWFELQRRVPLYKNGTTMPDGSLLGYDNDPNNVDKDNSPGELLVYYSPQGTLFQESNGNMWRKSETPNVWLPLGIGGGGSGGDSAKYDSVFNTVSAASASWNLAYNGGNLNVTGDINVTGSTTLSGDIVIDGDSILLGKSVENTLIIPFGKFDGDIIPSLTHTYDIGSTDLRWNVIYSSHVDTTSTLSRTVTSDTISLLGPGVGGPVSPTSPTSPIGEERIIETIDHVDVRNFKETHTVVSTYSAQWTHEHIHMLSRGSFTMDTPNTDTGFGTEREFLCMQSKA